MFEGKVENILKGRLDSIPFSCAIFSARELKWILIKKVNLAPHSWIYNILPHYRIYNSKLISKKFP
jgi:hypothetical protein